MKRMFCIVVCMVIIFSLAGCKETQQEAPQSNDNYIDIDLGGFDFDEQMTGEVEPEEVTPVAQYSFYIQTDPTYDIEAYRTLLPDGWKGSGTVNWDFASAEAPAYTAFVATSPDGLAGYARTTDVHFVEQIYSGAYNSNSIASSDGIPLRLRSTAVEMAYEIPPSIMTGLTDMHISGSRDLDPNKTADKYYKQVKGQILDVAVAVTGSTYSNLFCTVDEVSGTASVHGKPVEFKACITMCGYTVQTPGYALTITSNYWSALNTIFIFAPEGQMENYINDIDTIDSNYIDNPNWISLRSDVSQALYGLLREQQLQDWAAANAFSQALYANFYATYPYAGNYTSSSSGSIFDDDSGGSSPSIFESWEQTLIGQETYDLGSQGTMTVNGFYDNMWSDGSGNFIGSDNSAFNPGAGWNQVYTVTE